MEELSIEEKAKAYDEALNVAQETYTTQPMYRDWLAKMFPELKESEDEKIRKSLIRFLKSPFVNENIADEKVEPWIAWLEKQEENSAEPKWCHHKVDLSNCSEEYRKAYYDGWNNCNMQHSQCKAEMNDVIKCLIHGMKYYYEDNEDAAWGTPKWNMPVRHIIEVLKKQGDLESVDKVKPKFKVGDWITYGHCRCKISFIDSCYWYSKTCVLGDIASIDKTFHLWTLADAKDGDILVTENYIFIFKDILHGGVHLYCHYNIDDEEFDSDIPDAIIGNIHDKGAHFHPATKEQSDLLFTKMKEAGYEWDAEKKELKKIDTYQLSENPCSNCTNTKGCITCVNGDQKSTSTPIILYSDDVIEWLDKNTNLFGAKWCHAENIIEQFKEDFKL